MIKNPVHPGIIVKEAVLEPMNLTGFEAADRLGISLETLSHLINGEAAITGAIADQLERLGAGTARTWINLQATYDQWKGQPISEE